MKTFISLNNGRSKVLRGRFGGYEKGRCIHDDLFRRARQIMRASSWLSVAALEVAECQGSLSGCLHGLESLHPHDLGLPDLSLSARSIWLKVTSAGGITEVKCYKVLLVFLSFVPIAFILKCLVIEPQ
jgi:hypothetical protein